MKKTVIILLLFLVPALAFYMLWPSDADRIKKLFKEGAKAMESENLDDLMAKVSFNYRDDYGVTYLYLKEIMKKEFDRFSDIKVEYENVRIEVFKKGDSKEAVAEMNVRIVATLGTETGYIAGDVKDPLHLRFILEKERMKWLIVKAEGYFKGNEL